MPVRISFNSTIYIMRSGAYTCNVHVYAVFAQDSIHVILLMLSVKVGDCTFSLAYTILSYDCFDKQPEQGILSIDMATNTP